MASADERRALRALFEAIEARAPEAAFQRLFAQYPNILATALPLELADVQIVPGGRPGRSEPDFFIYPDEDRAVTPFGVVELKRPDSRIVTTPRKGVTILTRTARTAVEQARRYAEHFERQVQSPQSYALFLGQRSHAFVIMGLSAELAHLAADDVRSVLDQLPSNCQVLPYDVVLEMFDAAVSGPTFVLRPAESASRVRPSLALAPRGEPLSEREREMLEFERQWWRYAGRKEEAIVELFSLPPKDYYQQLSGLITTTEALDADPDLIKRLRRMAIARNENR